MNVLNSLYGRDQVEKYYLSVLACTKGLVEFFVPYLRRLIRFMSLPYCYFFLVNWSQCSRSKSGVVIDFLYIFFVLKYFPDNYSPCRLWEKPRSEWAYYYGSNYDPYQRKQLRQAVQLKKYEIIYEDKLLCHELCMGKNISTPEIISILESGANLKSELKLIAANYAPNSRFIVKPIDGKGGHAIYVAEWTGSDIILIKNSYKIKEDVEKLRFRSIVQSFIQQHTALNEFAKSVNTCRIVTMKKVDSSTFIIGAYIRFGIGNNLIDNVSQGGVSVCIDKASGKLAKTGYDKLSNKYTSHPTSSKMFENFKIPYWNDVVKLAYKVQNDLSFHKLMGMDIAVTENEPLLIEINAIYDNVALEQRCGPILSRPEVFHAYNNYNLLISNVQKKLAVAS